MVLDPAKLPTDIAALTALLIAADARAETMECRAAAAETRALDLDGQIAHLKLTIAKLQRDTHGVSSEKSARLLDQLELQLGELIATVSEGKVAAAIAMPAKPDAVSQKPARRPLSANLPRERVVHGAPCVCRHCGSDRIRKLGENVTETLEHLPAQWKVIQLPP